MTEGLTFVETETTYSFDSGHLFVIRKSIIVRAFVVSLFIVIALLGSRVIDRRPDGVGGRVIEAAVQLDPEIIFLVVTSVIRR